MNGLLTLFGTLVGALFIVCLSALIDRGVIGIPAIVICLITILVWFACIIWLGEPDCKQ